MPRGQLPRWSEATETERSAPVVPPAEPTIIAPHNEASARRLDPDAKVMPVDDQADRLGT